MKVLIISTNRHPLPIPVMPLGACMAADAALRSGHETKLLDLMFERDPARAIKDTVASMQPDVTGLSVRNIDNNDMEHPQFFVQEVLSAINTVREFSKSPVVLGGASMGVMPEEILRYTGAEAAVTGDGETVFPELLQAFSSGRRPSDIPGTARIENGTFINIPRNLAEHKGSCNFPDLSRWIPLKKYVAGLSMAPVQTKLGCHFKCIYCTYRKLEGSSYRFYDREKVLDHIQRLTSSGSKDIEFVDNVFNFPYEHASALCEGLLKIHNTARLYTMEMNPLFVDSPLLALMERAGFRGIGITAESASDKVLESLGKPYSAGDVAKAAACAKRGSQPCLWIFLLGGPGETEHTVTETLRFAEKFISRRDTVFFNIGIRMYPGTELELIARRQGLLALRQDEMLAPVFYFSPELDKKWLFEKMRRAMDSNPNFINSDSIGLPYLPLLHRIAYKMGLRSPLWKYTRFIKRGLRLLGADV